MVHDNSLTISLSEDKVYRIASTDGFALLDKKINIDKLKAMVLDDQAGALVSFEGLVRNHNNQRPVASLTYYGYEQLALNQGAKLINQAKEKFAISNAVAIHRIGALNIGDTAVWIGVSAAHRTTAFLACEWLLNQIKATIPVWKQEFYTDNQESLWLSNNG